jgi:hypothetical protein
LKTEAGKRLLFDPLRRKWVVAAPEEVVRQHLVHYLTAVKGYPASRTVVEKEFRVGGKSLRSDIVVYTAEGGVCLSVECKAPTVRIDQAVFDQLARYHAVLNARLLIVSNGLEHYCCSYALDKGAYTFLEEIPAYSEIEKNGTKL